MEIIGDTYALEITLGDYPSDSFCCTILVSKDIKKLKSASDELKKAIDEGYEKTVEFFEALKIPMPLQRQDMFQEMYRRELFEATIYSVSEV